MNAASHRRPGAELRSRVRASLDALRAVADNRDIGRLELSWAASVAADWTYVVAVMVAAYQADGIAAVGVVGVVRMLVASVAAPIVVGLTGRVDPQRLLLRVVLARIAAVGAAGVAIWLGAPPIVLLAGVAGEAGAFAANRPLQLAMLPSLARAPGELVAANVAASFGESIGTFVGPAIGGLALAAGGVELASAVVVALLAAAALAIVPVSLLELELEDRGARAATGAAAWRAPRARLSAGFGVVRRRAAPRLIVVAIGAQVVVRGILNVLLVGAAIHLLGLGASGVGLLTSTIGLGGLVGALGAMALVGRPRLAAPMALALALWGLPIGVVGALPTPAVAAAALFVVGVSNAVLDVAGFTLLQRIVPNDSRAAVLGLLEGVIGVGVAIGSAIGPVLVALLGLRGSLLITGMILPLIALATWPGLVRADDAAVVPGRELALLRSLPFFAPLPLAVLEQIAGRLQPVSFNPGELLTRQGEEGDTFYLIVDGELEIERDGRPVTAVGPSSAVGEIALVRRVPRTATVRAINPVRAFALAGTDFVAAVTATPQGRSAADEITSIREAEQPPSPVGPASST